MSQLFTTKYPNNIRQVVAGNPVSQAVFRDDVVLECNTAGVGLPFVLNLLEIPENFWNTTYKLYVNDIGNNASVRNITINAPSGQTINDLPSITINTNGGGVLIRVIDNYKYIATYNKLTSSGYNTVQDTGTPLTQRQVINFTGAGVTAVDDGINAVTLVNIPGGVQFEYILNASLITLINSNTVIPGNFYNVVDPINAVSVLVQGTPAQVQNGTTSLDGSGVFLNADYQGVGNYSGVVGFAGLKGIWEATVHPLGVVAGDVVIWFNRHYVNLTGVWGTAPTSDFVNWSILAKSQNNGYIQETDFIKYNVLTNTIIYRADKRYNEVDDFTNFVLGANSIDSFQWGKNDVLYNKVYSGGMMVCPNSNSPMYYNQIFAFGILFNSTTRITPGTFSHNIITEAGTVTVTDLRGSFTSNYVSGTSTSLNISNTEICPIDSNILTGGSQISLGSFIAGSSFLKNNISQSSTISVGSITSSCNFERLNMSNNGTLTFSAPVIAALNFYGCEISDNNNVFIYNLPRTFLNKKIRKDFSNWEETIDLDGGSFAANVFTIDPNFSYVGQFILANSTGKIISQIVNQPSNHSYTLKPIDTQTLGFQHTLIAGTVAGNMVCDAPAALNTITGRANGCDFIEYIESGNLCLRTNLVLLA